MKTALKALVPVGLACLLAAGQALAQESPWLVRGRLTYLKPNTSSDAGLAGALPADAITIDSKYIPEVDISYFFTPNFAAELVLTIPQKQTVTVNALGLGDIGTFKHLPPTLLAQYHFTNLGAFKPYVGLGLNYTLLGSENMSIGGQPVTLSGSSVGPAAQVGIDYKLNRNWYLNADFKKVYIKTDVKLNGSQISTLKVDPYLISLGVGYRF